MRLEPALMRIIRAIFQRFFYNWAESLGRMALVSRSKKLDHRLCCPNRRNKKRKNSLILEILLI